MRISDWSSDVCSSDLSASYLNLIEHGRRDVAGTLLRRLAAALSVEVGVLSGVEDARLVHDLTEVTADPLLQDLQLQPGDAQEVVGRLPNWGRALLRLHRSYQGASRSEGHTSELQSLMRN